MRPIDSHCHLGKEFFSEDMEETLQSIEKNLDAVINVGCDMASSRESIELAEKYSYIYAVVGIHPYSSEEYDENSSNELIKMLEAPKVVGIGESGLDYYRDIVDVNVQKKSFRGHLAISKKMNKPIVIHGREAYEDIVKILKEEDHKGVKGVFHSYAGSYDNISSVIDNFYISISGIATFPNAHDLRECIKKLPLDRRIVETDSPFLAPQAVRGKKNIPSYVKYVVEQIASIKGITVQEATEITNKNTRKLFNI